MAARSGSRYLNVTLSWRLILLVAAALLPLVCIQAYTQIELRIARANDLRNQVIRDAERVASQERSVLEGVKQLLQTLAELPAIRTGNAAECAPLFARIRSHFQRFEAFAATRADGSVFCITTPTTANGTLAGRDYFEDAMRTGRFAVGEYVIGKYTHRPVLTFALPYEDMAGRRAGVVAASLGLDWLADQLKGTQWNEHRTLLVADRNGTVLVREPQAAAQVGRPMPASYWRVAQSAAKQAQPLTTDVPGNASGPSLIAGMLPPGVGSDGLYTGVFADRPAAFAALNAATWKSSVLTVVATAVSLLLAWLFGRELIQKPVALLVLATWRWRSGEYGARSGLHGPSELEQLGAAFDEMADELQRAFAQKDVLLRELSHRVMNSLQNVASLLEVQSRSIKDAEARNQFRNAIVRINSVALAYRRMQATDGVETMDFAAFLRELCEDLRKSMMLDTNPCTVQADHVVLLGPDQAMPLALIVNELVTNALKHGSGPGVTIVLGRSDGVCKLAVRSAGSLPAGYDPESSPGFGMKMIGIMVRSLNGRLDAASAGGETEFSVTFAAKGPPPDSPVVGNGAAAPDAAGSGKRATA